MSDGRDDLYRRFKLPQEVTVLVDTREQYPVLFPATVSLPHPERPLASATRRIVKVKTEKLALDAGDYCLAEYPDVCRIERKGSAAEVWKNLFHPADMIRQGKAFRKLRGACKYPVLLLEMPPTSLLRPITVPGGRFEDGEALVHRLFMVAAKYQLQLMWLPWGRSGVAHRRELGMMMVEMMLAYALQESYAAVPEMVEV